MNRFLASLAVVALAGAPIAAGAQTLQPTLFPAAQSSVPPAADPHAFTAAPVSGLSPGSVAPSERAGSAEDAGPMNSTPFSGELSTVLTGSLAARSLNDSRGGNGDPSADSQSRD